MTSRRIFVFLCMLLMVFGLCVQAASPKVEFKESKYRIDVLVGGKLLTSYRHTPDPDQPLMAKGVLQTKPVLHPELLVTEQLPMRDISAAFCKVDGEDPATIKIVLDVQQT